jgi:ubiquitin-activating enzyme E1
MNPKINVIANLNRVGIETEDIYTDEFFDSLDLVCNALDNVKARLYTDKRIIQSSKPLIESGTLGTVANTQIILPHLTESYGSSQDPEEKSIPLCTLKNFPNAIEHTLQWARDKFEGLFHNPAMSALNYSKDSDKFLTNLKKLTVQQQLEELEQLEKVLIIEKCSNFQDCIHLARNNFEEFFSNCIKQLLFNFPADLKTESGLPFWSGLKRCPHPLKFDINNTTHFEYIVSVANLLAYMHGIKQSNDTKYIQSLLKNVKVINFEPKSGVVIKVNDSDETNTDDLNDEDELRVQKLLELFEKSTDFKSTDLKLAPIEFEKDDDTNYHMDFITSCSNLRAENYDIAPTDKHNVSLTIWANYFEKT